MEPDDENVPGVDLLLDANETTVVVVDYGLDPEEETVFETLEDAESALGPLPVAGPEDEEVGDDES